MSITPKAPPAEEKPVVPPAREATTRKRRRKPSFSRRVRRAVGRVRWSKVFLVFVALLAVAVVTTLAGAGLLVWQTWLAAFVLFRLFDIWRPPPVRQAEALPGGAGIIADDVVAGVYGALVLFAAGCFNFE